MSGILEVVANIKVELVKQLYDDWSGWYMLRRMSFGKWNDVKVLNRGEALNYRLGKNEALELKHVRLPK